MLVGAGKEATATGLSVDDLTGMLLSILDKPDIRQ